MNKITRTTLLFLFCGPLLLQAAKRTNMTYTVTMENPASHIYHVELVYTGFINKNLEFNMSAWTPGFYEIKDFAGAVKNFQAYSSSGKKLKWEKTTGSTWQVSARNWKVVRISYDVSATNPFIGDINLDENYGYIIPGALFLYLKDELQHPVTVQIKPYHNWPQKVATSLQPLPGRPSVFVAANFDVLFDSPFLIGKTEILPETSLHGRPVQFVGYQLGAFDRQVFISDLKKIVKTGSAIVGVVPFDHYTFLAVGIQNGGFGGIEHLSSASLLINTQNLFTTPKRKADFYSFLAHEYFHLYNIKRIRPIALGPFDYSRENYSNMLWVSEGITDYYSYLIARRAGLVGEDYVLANFQEHIKNYENSPGHLYQTLIQSSHDIWAVRGAPQTRTPQEESKTISVYDKGCTLGLFLDLTIRHETKNRKSLDDVMRLLYHRYYKLKKRGFTDAEFQQACEQIAGISLNELFAYASTLNPLNYPKYFAYAGLQIDTTSRLSPLLYTGATVGFRDSSVVIRKVDYPSSAYDAGLKQGDKIWTVDGIKVNGKSYDAMLEKKGAGDMVLLHIKREGQEKDITVTLSLHYEKSFAITRMGNPDQLQSAIYRSWLSGKE